MKEEKKKSKSKIHVERTIFAEAGNEPFTWKDIKHLNFEDEDEIQIGYREPYYSENSSSDGHYFAIVTRMVLENDEQFAMRQADNERDSKWAKERRRESYEKLKKEFENQ